MLRRRKNIHTNRNESKQNQHFKSRQFTLPILKAMKSKPCLDMTLVFGIESRKHYQPLQKQISNEIQKIKYTKKRSQQQENTPRKYAYHSTKYTDLFSERMLNTRDPLQKLQKNIKSHLNSVEIQRTPLLMTKRQKDVSQLHNKYFVKLLTKDSLLRDKAEQHILYGIQSFKILKNIILCPNHLEFKAKKLPPTHKKTLILDLDETLIHTSQEKHPQHVLTTILRSPNGQYEGYVTIRPYAKQFLKNVHQAYEIIIFTAAIESYANPIIDQLDPDDLIQHRFFRDSCTLIQNKYYLKDLRIFGRSLKDMLIVDNSPYTYFLQPDNGVPIIPFQNDMEDAQLLALQEYLLGIAQTDDIMYVNSQTFLTNQYAKYHTAKTLISSLYNINF